MVTMSIGSLQSGFGRCASSIHGAAAVFLQRRRDSSSRRDAIIAGVLALAWIGLAVALRYLLFGEPSDGAMTPTRTARDWLSPSALSAVLVLMLSAAVIGAAAAPSNVDKGEIEAALAAGVTSKSICGGRLIAALQLCLIGIFVSYLDWFFLQAFVQVVPPSDGGWFAILLAHIAMLCGTLMSGAVGFLFSIGESGSSRGTGIAIGLLFVSALIAGPVLIQPFLHMWDDPSSLIAALLIINPVWAVDNALGRDILHSPWIYAHTSAADYNLPYLPVAATAALYLAVGVAALWLSSVRLRRWLS